MHYLLLVIICSTSIALILKYNDTKKGELIVLLAGNYLVASSIALVLLILNESKSFSYQTLLYGAGLGFLFVITFFLLAFAISRAGMGLAITSSRLSVIIPIILSIIFFNESPTELHLLGFLFTIITFVMFYFSVKSGHKDGDGMLKYFFLIAVFLGIGINDFALKYFKVWRSELEEPYFIFFIFSSAFIYSSFYIILKKIKIKPQTAMLGLVLGIPNVTRNNFSFECSGFISSYISISIDECRYNSFHNINGISDLERKIKPMGNLSSRQRSISNFVFEYWRVNRKISIFNSLRKNSL